ALKVSPIGRDCLMVAESDMIERQWADTASLAEWRAGAVQQVEEVVAKVQREPGPDPYKEEWCALASKHLSEGHEHVG
ncbi:MAG: thiamine pyrophosphate-dependent dehydrogenase E1 component subunit alpha, partial [Limisphaerales bacterium]